MGAASAIGGAVGLSAVSAITGGLIRDSAAKKAAKRNAAANERAIALQEETAAQQRQDAAPFVEAGQRAVQTLSGTAIPFQSVAVNGQIPDGVDPFSVGLPTFEDDELFRFRSEQGERLINRALAQRGLSFSGPAFESLANFNRQLTGEAAANERNRLFGLASLGANANAGVASNATNLQQLTSRSLANVGAAQSQGALLRGEAQAGIFEGVAGAGAAGIGSGLERGLF